MSRRIAIADHVADLGPSVIRTSTGKLASAGPGAVVIEDREDIARAPDRFGKRPIVRGARRHSVLLDLYGRSAINKPMFGAALRFQDDMSLAAGVSSRDAIGGGSAPWQRTPHQAQLDAMRRVRHVVELLQLNERSVTWWVVVLDQGPREFEALYHMRHGTGTIALRLDLQALDNHYHSGGGSGRSTKA